ncbi:protein kinase domain-containing protein [Dictyobacter formicarum]|uniref:Protein kinase domain-containing protein n=1 Tax=Dictyobacter formicarum TaxID=2778368 RepID=A0ABQ3VU30_9CHLR|nr:right-handed parallel beta-helix repeat-containing protein [Dictyobacter formicarum]GHO88811.1 hypothetical protein KSZ_68170 [Dictyobacter formicarum]
MNASVRFCDNCGTTNRPDAKFCYACGQPQISYATTNTVTGLLTSAYELKQRYHILQKLGQGGFGAIYKAADLLFNDTPRAVKEMGMRGLDEQETKDAIVAFRNEATLLANLSHPNLPRIYDHFEEHGRWYLVMDYIEGETLEKRLEQAPGGYLPLKEVVELGIQLCTVLSYLHSHEPPIIFRDLKPDNVMLTADGQVYLIDFGIARFFKPGQTKDTMNLGTPGYAAPEQYGRMQTTIRSDIYSLGATLYQLISGIHPGLTPFLQQPLDLDASQPANVALEKLVMQMLELKEDQRPRDAQVVKQELQNVQQMLQSASVKRIVQPIATAIPASTTTALSQATRLLATQEPRPSIVVAQQGGDYTSLSEAIQQAEPGSFIFVREGLYKENIILDKPVEIIGNGPRAQIILESSNTDCIVMQTAAATLRGLTIRCLAGSMGKAAYALHISQGELFIEDCDITSSSSACISITSVNANPTIRYCTIHDGAGYGITISQNARATIEYCEIFNHPRAGIHITTGADPILRHCNISNSERYGLFIIEQGRGTFEDCDIHHHGYAGATVSTLSNPLLLRCQLHDNLKYGVEVLQEGQGSYQDCEIAGSGVDNVSITTGSTPYFYLCRIHEAQQHGVKVSDNGRGILEYCNISACQQANVAISSGGDPQLQRDTISHSQQYGVAVFDGGHGTIEHCILTDNARGALSIERGCEVVNKQNTLHSMANRHP